MNSIGGQSQEQRFSHDDIAALRRLIGCTPAFFSGTTCTIPIDGGAALCATVTFNLTPRNPTTWIEISPIPFYSFENVDGDILQVRETVSPDLPVVVDPNGFYRPTIWETTCILLPDWGAVTKVEIVAVDVTWDYPDMSLDVLSLDAGVRLHFETGKTLGISSRFDAPNGSIEVHPDGSMSKFDQAFPMVERLVLEPCPTPLGRIAPLGF